MNRLTAWKRQDRRTVLRTSIFSVTAEKWKAPATGKRHRFFFLEAPEWINIVPVDDSGRVMLIRQYRYGSRRLELEIPGGAVDHRDSSPLSAARRELKEETGCVARRWIRLGRVHPNPAFQRNHCHLFLALGIRRVAKQELDFAEEISLAPTPLKRIPGLIAGGKIPHALVICAFEALFRRPDLVRKLMR